MTTLTDPVTRPVQRLRNLRHRRPRRIVPSGLGIVGWLSLAVILVAGFLVVFGPLIAPYPPNRADLSLAYVRPGAGHLLGFDSQGRDLLSRLLVGARSSLLGPMLVVLLSMGVGTALAVLSAWRRGWLDAALSAALDIVFAFPGVLLAVLAAAVFGPSELSAALSVAVAYLPYVARIARAAAMRERNQPYIEALEVQGNSALSICVRHIVPNIRALLVAEGAILFGWATLDLAAIAFLGLGVTPPQADWGVMVSEGETGVLQGFPTESLIAGAAIVLVVVAFNLLGEQLSERNGADAR
ncbi:MAG: ABC transporter permease [Actinomycetota bacterium]|nr:ABC transporter permease [Actinomycetota bacterium]